MVGEGPSRVHTLRSQAGTLPRLAERNGTPPSPIRASDSHGKRRRRANKPVCARYKRIARVNAPTRVCARARAPFLCARVPSEAPPGPQRACPQTPRLPLPAEKTGPGPFPATCGHCARPASLRSGAEARPSSRRLCGASRARGSLSRPRWTGRRKRQEEGVDGGRERGWGSFPPTRPSPPPRGCSPTSYPGEASSGRGSVWVASRDPRATSPNGSPPPAPTGARREPATSLNCCPPPALIVVPLAAPSGAPHRFPHCPRGCPAPAQQRSTTFPNCCPPPSLLGAPWLPPGCPPPPPHLP